MNENPPVVVSRARSRRPSLGQKLWRQRYLLLMPGPFLLWALVLHSLPLAGRTMAFQDCKPKASPADSFLKAPFVGLKHFELLWQDFLAQGRFYLSPRNTLVMSLLPLTIGFVAPIAFALLINELCKRMFKRMFKRVMQTVSYLPPFTFWVVVAGMISTRLSSEGPVHNLLMPLGHGRQRLAGEVRRGVE